MDQENAATITGLSLDQWFINYQLRALQNTHFYSPASIDIDVTDIVLPWSATKPSAFATAIMIKSAGLVLEAHPEMNRFYCRSFFGARIVQLGYIAVNVPMRIEFNGRSTLSAVVIRDPHKKSIAQINADIRAAREAGLTDKPISAFVTSRRNTWYNRFLLKLLHGIVYRVPSLFVRRGAGGVSVSSLLSEAKGSAPVSGISFGPTAFTLALTSLWQDQGRWKIRVGIAFDHYTGGGDMAMRFIKALGLAASGENREAKQSLLEGATATNEPEKTAPLTNLEKSH